MLHSGKDHFHSVSAIVTQCIKKTNADPSDIKNYWPISNLRFVTKLAERLVGKQLLERKHLLIHQSAFQKNQSTDTSVLKIVSDSFLLTDHGDVTLLGMLEVLAAFARVDHDIPTSWQSLGAMDSTPTHMS